MEENQVQDSIGFLTVLQYKRYEISNSGKRIKNKHVQQGIRVFFVGFPENSSGWLFYVPITRRTYISIDAIFDENFKSPLSMPDLLFQGALKLRGINTPILNTETLTVVTGPSIVEDDKFQSELVIPPLTRSKTSVDEHDSLTCFEGHQQILRSTNNQKNRHNTTDDNIKASFTEMAKPNDMPYSEYLHIAYDLS